MQQMIKTLPLWFQFTTPLLFGITGMVLTRLLLPELHFEWRVAAVFILLFVVINPVKGIFQSNWLRYTAISLPLFITLFVVLLFCADVFSLKPIYDIAEYKLIFLLFLLFYFLLTLMALLYRTINKMLKDLK